MLSTPSTRTELQDENRERIDAAMKLKCESRSRVFDSRLPRSWISTLRALFSYALLFSDIPRSTIGVRSLSSSATMFEPDKIQSFGPASYYVSRIHKNETASLDAPSIQVWPYKFDTTSIIWRALAEFLAIDVFPDCVFYHSKCASTTLPSAVVFDMINALPSALARRQQPHDPHEPVTLALGTLSLFKDKVHHYVLPQLFLRPNTRTNQVIYYPPQLLARSDFRICSTSSPSRVSPNFCYQQWTRFERSCSPDATSCRSIGHVSKHIIQRARSLQTEFPDAEVDLTILESSEVPTVIRGGVCYVGRQNMDISTILRVRNCSTLLDAGPTEHVQSGDRCETVLVHDFRYEAVGVTTDVMQWYSLVATLRTIGQGYFYVRVFALFLGCYVARASEENSENATRWTRLRAAWQLFIRVPCQCVIHGCKFPIICYICAHIIDVPFTYEAVGDRFSTANGLFKIGFWDFCLIAAVQMRSLWLFALCAQTVMAFFTQYHDPDWSPAHGVLGVRGFFVSTLASCTIFGLFRSILLRDSRVMSIHELARPGSTNQEIRLYSMKQRGTRDTLLEGVYIDVKLILCALILALAIKVLWSCIRLSLQHWCETWRSRRRVSTVGGGNTSTAAYSAHTQLQSVYKAGWTPVPYSAGALWPITAACTRWGGTVFSDAGAATPLRTLGRNISLLSLRSVAPDVPAARVLADSTKSQASVRRPASSRSRSATQSAVIKPLPATDSRTFRRALAATLQWSTWPQTGRPLDTLQFIQEHMEQVHARHPDVDAVVALFNLVMMSDPLVFCALKLIGAGKPLAFYETNKRAASSSSSSLPSPSHIVLLPQTVADTCFLPEELTLLATVNSRDLVWSDLIHCG